MSARVWGPGPHELFRAVPRGPETPKGADFAVTLDCEDGGTYIKKGQTVFVSASGPVDDGDVGIFMVSGEMLCRQYCEDSFGNIYLFTLDRAQRDRDLTIFASSNVPVICFGKVLLKKKPHLPAE